MIALDFDGVVANYGDHTTDLRFNDDLLRLIPSRAIVAICTNQGGMALHTATSSRYPSPERVAFRLLEGVLWLNSHGVTVREIHISCYHPKAGDEAVQRAARKLRNALNEGKQTHNLRGLKMVVWTTDKARKPRPLMLKQMNISSFYGDSPEDAEAARTACVPFHAVERFY